LPLCKAAGHIHHVHQFVQAEDTSRLMTVGSPRRGRRQDGNEFPVEIPITKLADGGQTVLAAIARDITQRRQAEEALAEGEERYRARFENSIDGVFAHRTHR
jgi:PAS domain S-box-containing protein